MTTQTTRSRDGDHFVVEGPRGAVEYHLAHGFGGAPFLEYHSPRPFWDGQAPERWPCPVIGNPCYRAGQGDLEATLLYRDYVVDGQDDEIIWRELERRYAEWEAEG